MLEIISNHAEETEAAAAALAQKLRAGDVLAYFGGLGAGKTFALVHEYTG